jgi:predicted ATPase
MTSREGQLTQERVETLMTLATDQGFSPWLAYGTILRGWVLAARGQGEEGIEQMRQGMVTLQAMRSDLRRSQFLALLAEAYTKVGKAKEGLNVLSEALDFADKIGERYYEAELYRLKGTLTLQQESQKAKGKAQKSKVTDPRPPIPDPQGEAEACFLKAIDISRQQQAKSLELRATMSLARLWQQQGRRHEAHNRLSAIYNWFTEGFDTKDLQEAKALLEALKH